MLAMHIGDGRGPIRFEGSVGAYLAGVARTDDRVVTVEIFAVNGALIGRFSRTTYTLSHPANGNEEITEFIQV